jgi:hypothetical protein
VVGILALEAPALRDLAVTLTSSHPSVAVPVTLTFAAGEVSQMFSVPTTAVTSPTAVRVTAAANGVSTAATLTVRP